jgi:hypothetical protein
VRLNGRAPSLRVRSPGFDLSAENFVYSFSLGPASLVAGGKWDMK